QLDLESDEPGAQDLVRHQHQSIEIRHVTFRYPDRDAALDDVSLMIPAKECVGIVGASGSGKTTLFNLLLHFDTPQQGNILIGGIDIQHVTLTSLRNMIAIVPQDIVLFDDTILENVRYGKPDAGDEEVYAACRLSQTDGFIGHLPQQYKTIVGERGVKLSGGERQRIAIARALLKDAPILLLDEATSSLDAQLEFQLQFALDWAVQGRTTIIIAHRLATVIHLPRIVVFHQGKILDDGTHEELLDRCEHYRNLVSNQLISSELSPLRGKPIAHN
ncbi:MAG TPA: ATP-binding cassette domain-containing protein, partial [Bacteroidota bacterium]|nr:ATP-binding cassette domain-containing protein [Bacteroidota bacterium]